MSQNLIDGTRSIMRPADIEINDAYEEAEKTYKQVQKDYYAKRRAYLNMVKRLNAKIDPEMDEVYNIIDALDNDYLLNTPRAKVWQEQVRDKGYDVSQAKFGRMMKELGHIRTTRTVNGKVVARWKKS